MRARMAKNGTLEIAVRIFKIFVLIFIALELYCNVFYWMYFAIIHIHIYTTLHYSGSIIRNILL